MFWVASCAALELDGLTKVYDRLWGKGLCAVAEFTQVQGSYRLRVSEASRVAAADLLGPVSPEGEFLFRASNTAELNRWIDRLRAAAVEIEALTRERSTLEDFFIEVVRE